MYSRRNWRRVGGLCIVLGASAVWAADMGTAFTYQGYLEKPAGTPVTNTCDFRFQLYDAAAGGNLMGTNPENKPGVTVDKGVFTVTGLDFGPDAIDGTARWLEIEVCCPSPCAPTLLTPRVELTPAPHALALPGLYTQQNATSPNIIGGYSGNAVTSGVVGATITGGGSSGIGNNNTVTDDWGTVGGGLSNQAGDGVGTTSDEGFATVGGGQDNTASARHATVGGGLNNQAGSAWDSIGGGVGNVTGGNTATVAGGGGNQAVGTSATVGGGFGNKAGTGVGSTVGGGVSNEAEAPYATISGGGPTDPNDPTTTNNRVWADYGVIGGGGGNRVVNAAYATVGGGQNNDAQGAYATIAGGGPSDPINPTTTNNVVYDDHGTIGGGGGNRAGSDDGNRANAAYTTVGGGDGNMAQARYTTVSGGKDNEASAQFATIGGGGPGIGTSQPWICHGGPNAGSACGRCQIGGAACSVSSSCTPFPNCIRDDTVCPGSCGAITVLTAGNRVTDDYGTIGGGAANRSGDDNATPSDASHATVAGGKANIASAQYATVGGGSGNTAENSDATVGGGGSNHAAGSYSVVGGGSTNTATGSVSTIGGGSANDAASGFSTVGGGYSNLITDDYGTIGGGQDNQAGDNAGTTTDRPHATVGGGYSNIASGVRSTVGGGSSNTASGYASTVGGGLSNTASGAYSTVPGGTNNTASGSVSTVAGDGNTASGDEAAVGGGGGNTASGLYSTVPGGYSCEAGGDYSFAAGRQAHVRSTVFGDAATDNGTFLWADSTAADFLSSGSDQFLIRAAGGVGLGTASATAPRAQLDVVKSGNTVAVFDRTTNDGTIISLRQAGTEEGTISVSGTTVSYNAFTGSHYGWTNQLIGRSTLVVMTGENRRRHDDDPGAEPVYGIVPSSTANDPKCLGAYLGLLEPTKPVSLDNPHQIMAVGNGDMWVVDTGRNIEPGQYLISSDLKGHAMLDDEARFPVGYVIARAGEPVEWANVSDAIDGHKHKRISVFFESFERGSAVAVGKSVAAQQSEIGALKSRVATLERAFTANAPSARPVSLASIGGFAIPALALLGFVGLIVRSRTQNGGGR